VVAKRICVSVTTTNAPGSRSAYAARILRSASILDLRRCSLVLEPKKNDASVWFPLTEYHLAEVFVIRNQNPILSMRLGKDIIMR
jgi:hypothetical protein